MFPASTKGGGVTVAFPDVCKVPAPPAPFAPVPYPNMQYEENLKAANKADAKARSGGEQAKKDRDRAIESLFRATGKRVSSATKAVMIGKVMHRARNLTLPDR